MVEVGPFGPWQEPAGSDRIGADPPLPASLWEDDSVYRGLAVLGWHPREVDDLEIWLIARLLGVGDDLDGPAVPMTRSVTLRTDDDSGEPERPADTLARMKAMATVDPDTGRLLVPDDWGVRE